MICIAKGSDDKTTSTVSNTDDKTSGSQNIVQRALEKDVNETNDSLDKRYFVLIDKKGMVVNLPLVDLATCTPPSPEASPQRLPPKGAFMISSIAANTKQEIDQQTCDVKNSTQSVAVDMTNMNDDYPDDSWDKRYFVIHGEGILSLLSANSGVYPGKQSSLLVPWTRRRGMRGLVTETITISS